jgi:integrase/recombinase XerD
MSPLRQASKDYLQIRRALGFKLQRAGQMLPSFIDYLESVGAQRITTEHAVAWAALPAGAQPVYWAARLTVVRGFARYLQTLDPATEIPPTGLPGFRGTARPTPYLYSQAEIVALMDAASSLQTRLGAATMRTVIGLLAVTGMRIGEAVRLDRADLDLGHARLVVRNSKFGKSRQLPLDASTITALRDYLRLRDHVKPHPITQALLIGTRGDRLNLHACEWTFRLLRNRIGLTARPGCRAPRLHDLRHSFAVQTMLDSYRTDGDPTGLLATLSTYLGHADPGATYWYLSAAPELLALAATRLEEHLTEVRS